MAGYVRNRAFKLVFADPEMEGLEVRAKSTSIGQYFRLTQLGEVFQGATDNPNEEELEQIQELLGMFTERLTEWNLEEEDGTPVPMTVDGLMDQDPVFVWQVITAWMNAVAGVSGPKEQNSNGGPPSVEALIPMEAFSESQAS